VKQTGIPIPNIGFPTFVIALAVLVLVLYLQLTTRSLRERSLIAVILVVVGAANSASVLSHISPSLRDIGLLVLSLTIGISLAAVRALTIRIWADGDQVLRRGTVLTALLWVVSLAQHMIVGGLLLGDATLLIYFGSVLIAQQQVLMIRARSQGLFARPA
jgi:hypothetical protein